MAMLSIFLHETGHPEDAVAMGLEAIGHAPDSMEVRNIIGHSFSSGVQGFHVPILLDEARNAAYAQAIARMVHPGMRVLEIGTGSGLLAMLCAQAGALVTTCETNPIIAATARAIIDRNGLSDRVRVVAKHSNQIRIPEDMDAPADLLVHEIFGSRLVDEGVTSALIDSRARLLAPKAPSLPPAAEIRCALARSDVPRKEVGLVQGFDLSLFNLLNAPGRRPPLRKRKGVQYCSKPASVLRMDYDSPAPFGPEKETQSLISTGGRVDGILQWIRLDFGAGNLLENNPLDGGFISSWGAALFDFVTPLETKVGDVIDVTISHNGMRLLIDALPRLSSVP